MKGKDTLTRGINDAQTSLEAAGATSQETKKQIGEIFAKGGPAAKAFARELAALKDALNKGTITAKEYGTALAGALKQSQERTRELQERMKKAADEAAERWARVKAVITGVFAAATASIVGFVRSGISGTTMAEYMGLQWQLLSREIAQLFVPVMFKVIEVVQRATSWFRSLSGDQQNFLGRLLLVAGGLGILIKLFPIVVGGIRAIGAAIAANPIGLVLTLVAAFASLVLATEEGQRALQGMFSALAPAFAAIGQIFTDLVDQITPVLNELAGALGPVLAQIGQALGESLQQLVPVLREVISTAAPVIMQLVRALLPVLQLQMQIGRVVIAALGPVFRILGAVFTAFRPIIELLGQLAERFGERMAEWVDRLMPVFERVANFIEELSRRIDEAIARLQAATGSSDGGRSWWMNALIASSPAATVADWLGWLPGSGSGGGGPTRPGSSSSGSGAPRNALQSSQTGFEGVAETWRRFQLAAIRQDVNTPENRTAHNTAVAAQMLTNLWNALPAWVRAAVATPPVPPPVAVGPPGGP